MAPKAVTFGVWWCRVFLVLTTLMLTINICVRDLFWASTEAVLLVVYLYFLDFFNQRRRISDD